MAVRAIDNQRVYGMVFAEERRRKDSSGNYIKLADGSYDLMSNDEALSIAESEGFTVIFVRGQNVRQRAEARDRMIEVHSKGGEIVQKIATGSLEMNTLLGSIVGWKRLLPPTGKCEICGCEHTEEFLDFDALRNSRANKGQGIYANEICVNHLDDMKRAEIVAFVNSRGEEKLGEG